MRQLIQSQRRSQGVELSEPLRVLLVSHGGFIKELLMTMAARNCRFPSKDYKTISPNTGITKV